MNFKPEELTVTKLFNNNVVYVVPRYQRNYVWDEKNIRQLLDDIKYSKIYNKKTSHFLGTMVFSEKTKYAINYKYIIDGQQRITTLLLCIISLIYLDEAENKKKYSEQIANDIIFLKGLLETTGRKEKVLKLSCASKNFQYLCEYTLASDNDKIDQLITNNSNDSYIKGFHNCLKIIEEIVGTKYKDLDKYQDTFLDTRVITISSENEPAAYSIFEILNARGIQLEQFQLLKNFILRGLQPGKHTDEYNDRWMKIEENLNNSKINRDTFLLHFSRCFYPIGSIDKDNIYELIKKEEIKKGNLLHLFETIEKDVKTYIDIANMNMEPYEKTLYQYFDIKNVVQIRPLLLSLKNKVTESVITQKEYCVFLEILSKMFIGFSLSSSGGNSNRIHPIIASHSYQIYHSNNKNNIYYLFYSFINSIIKYYPKYDNLLESIANIKFSNKNTPGRIGSKLFLYLITPTLKNSSKISFDIDNFNIDHIIGDNENDKTTWEIGNLMPLPKELHKTIKTDNITEKIKKYKLSGIQYLVDFANYYSDFNLTKISDRTKLLAREILNKISINKENIEAVYLEYYIIKKISEKYNNYELKDALKTKSLKTFIRFVEENSNINLELKTAIKNDIKLYEEAELKTAELEIIN